MIYLSKDGFLLDDVSSFTPFETEFLDRSDKAHLYLNAHVKFQPGVTVGSVISLVEKNQILKEILSDYDLDKFFSINNESLKEKTNYFDFLKIYNTAEFNYYSNAIDINPTPFMLGYKTEGDNKVPSGLDFITLNDLIDVPIVLDSLVVAQAECLLNAPNEQNDLFFNTPNFTLLAVLEAIFTEINPHNTNTVDDEIDADITVEEDTSLVFNKPLNMLNLGDNVGKEVFFTNEFSGNKKLVFSLIGAIPSHVNVAMLLKEVFGDKVYVKSNMASLNAYEFRLKSYGLSKNKLPCDKTKMKKSMGLTIRGDIHDFSNLFWSLLSNIDKNFKKEKLIKLL